MYEIIPCVNEVNQAIAPVVIAGIIAAVSAAINGIRNTIEARRAAKKQNEQQMAMAEYANNKDIENWNRTNEYNLPENQMARLVQAGLNPNLAYGSGTSTTAHEINKYQMPRMANEFFPMENPIEKGSSLLSMYNDTKLKNAQADLLSQQSKAVLQKTINDGIKQGMLNTDASKKKLALQYQQSFLEENLRQLKNKTAASQYYPEYEKFKTNEMFNRSRLSNKGQTLGMGAEQKILNAILNSFMNSTKNKGFQLTPKN